MNIRSFRSKRVIVPTLAAVAVFGVGGVVYANTAAGDELKGDELDRASSAALEATGGGKVTDTERDDEEGAYEIEVTKDDGSQVDVHLDEDFAVISEDADREDDGDDDGDDDGRDDRDADDRALSEQERTSAEQAALEAVPGTVTDVEASDDDDTRGEAYEVEVVKDDLTEWTVELDADFGVLDQRQDD